MKTLFTQLIIILALLISGLLLLQKYAGSGAQLQELGTLRYENADLRKSNEKLAEQNEELASSNEQLSLANRYLKTDFRTARIEVLEQKTDSADSERVLETKIRFTEFDPNSGSIVATPAEFAVGGDRIYVDALIVKFADVLVESSDALKNRSLVSFQRIFGENQSPAAGFRIDAEGQIPSIYRSGSENEEVSALETQIWENFWAISNDPERQKSMGIRAIHGEAPSQRLQPGRIYYLELRASGGLSFRVE